MNEDIVETFWEQQLPGERIEMNESDLAGPSMRVLAEAINYLPKTGECGVWRARGIDAFNNLKNILNYLLC